METDHTFSPKHGFTGSAHVTKEHRPTIAGFKRGMNGAKAGNPSVPASEVPGMTANETGPIEGIGVTNMKHGGLAHIKSHHKNYAHGGRVEHDSHPKHESHGKHDKHGFHIHKGHSKHKD